MIQQLSAGRDHSKNNFWTISGLWMYFWFDFWPISGYQPESAGIAGPEFRKCDKTRGKCNFPSAGIRRHPPASAGIRRNRKLSRNCPEIVRKFWPCPEIVRKLFSDFQKCASQVFFLILISSHRELLYRVSHRFRAASHSNLLLTSLVIICLRKAFWQNVFFPYWGYVGL